MTRCVPRPVLPSAHRLPGCARRAMDWAAYAVALLGDLADLLDTGDEWSPIGQEVIAA